MKRIFALLLVSALLIVGSAFAEDVPVVVWGATQAPEEAPVTVWGTAPAAEEAEPAAEEAEPAAEETEAAVEEAEAAVEEAATDATEEGVRTYSWDEFQNYAQLMGAEGLFYEYSQFNLQMFVPSGLAQMEVSEEDKAAGILDVFQGDEHSLQIVTQFSFIGEGIESVEDLLNVLDEETFDVANTTTINPYNALLVSRDGGQTLVVAISGGDGYFFQVTYHNMIEEQWNTDMTALSMASIQPMDAPEA